MSCFACLAMCSVYAWPQTSEETQQDRHRNGIAAVGIVGKLPRVRCQVVVGMSESGQKQLRCAGFQPVARGHSSDGRDRNVD